MRKIANTFLLLLALFASSAFAQQSCRPSSFSSVIQFDVVGQGNTQQSLRIDRWVLPDYYLWYTGNRSSSFYYIFNEDYLELGSLYRVRISYSFGSLNYYLKNVTSGGPWERKESISGLDSAIVSILFGLGYPVVGDDSIYNLNCDADITEEPEVVELDLCAYFPDSFQSNDIAADGRVNGSFSLNGDRNTISLSTKRELAFSQILASGHNSGCIYGNGGVESCLYDANLNYEQFPASLSSFSVDGPEEVCMDGCKKQLPPGNYKKIEIGRNNSEIILSEGEYWVNNLVFSADNAKLSVLGEVVLHFNTILFQGDRIKINESGDPDDLWLLGHLGSQDFRVTSNSVTINAALFLDPVGYANGVFVQGDRFTFQGSLTASKVFVSGNDSLVIGTNVTDCSRDQTSSYQLELTPISDIALVCETITPTLSVMSNGAVATDFNGTATVNVNGVETSVSITNGTATIDLSTNGESQTVAVNASLDGYSDVSSVSGNYEFVPFKFAVDDQYVIANKQQPTTVSALACSSGEQVDVGYNGQPTVSSSWQQPSNGSGALSFSPVLQDGVSTEDSRALTLEDSGEMVVTLTDESFDCSDLDDCPIDGNGKLTGQFMVYSRPWTFAICSTSDTNLDSATGNVNGGNGFIPAGETFSAQVIPLKYQSDVTGEVATNSGWCSPSNITTNFFLEHLFANSVELSSEVASPTNANSTALLASNDGLSKERENNDSEYLFTNLYWDEVGSLKVMAATESYNATCSSVSGLQAWYECTQRGYREVGRFYPAYFEITQSDWSVSEQNNISYLSQPYDLAEFTVLPRTSKENSVKNYDKFAGGLRATLNILQDEDIGSDRLALSVSNDNNWQYDTSSSESNWHLADLSAVFYRDVTLNSSNKNVSEVDGPFNIPTEDLIGDELSTSTRFGFVVQGGGDPVETRGQVLTSCLNESSEFNGNGELSSCSLLFPTQPPSRYGRMKLFDVGGTSTISSIRVPLQIEYWNGTQFVVNTDDSNSVFSTDGNKTCQQVLWRELVDGAAIVQEASLAGASGEETVSEGASSLVTAEPATTDVGYIRQQVRFWLRLDNDNTVSQQGCSSASVSKAQPWLRYNWWKNQDGSINEDEDPSAVVTFGIHRGNDRIIFRGESNLTGQ